MSPARQQLIKDCRAHRDAWMRQARDYAADGIRPGLSVQFAQLYQRKLVAALRGAK